MGKVVVEGELGGGAGFSLATEDTGGLLPMG